MTDNHDIEANAAKLAAEVQEASANNKGRGPVGKGRALAAAGVFGIAALGVGAMFLGGGGDTAPKTPETAKPDTFQTAEGSPFGQLAAPKRETVVEKDTSETDALRAQLAALQDELARMKEAPNPAPEAAPAPETPQANPQLDALSAQLAALTEKMNASEAEQARMMADKDRQLASMQAALDAATLQGARLGSDPALDEAQARRAAAQEAYQRRVNSGMIAYGGGGEAGSGAEGGAGASDGTGQGSSRKMSANEAFAREGAAAAKVERAKLIVNPANTVIQGTMIQAVLETFINSDLPGQIRAVVAEDVHSYDGSRVLIPRGSKLFGQYSDNVEIGQRRAMVVWTRIVMPDNQSVELAGIGGDAVGQSGLAGRVNAHFGSRFGGATLLSLLSLAPAIAVDNATDATTTSSDSSTDPATGAVENMTSALAPVMSEVINRKPTITVRQGSTVTIMVDRDLEIF